MSVVLLMALLQAGAVPVSAVEQVAVSGRVIGLTASPSERVSPPRLIAPGEPPLLRFRYLEGKARHRFGELGLILDDAGH